MHICGHCKDPVPAFDKPREAHLVVAKSREGKIFTHGDLENKVVLQELLDAAASEVGIVSKIAGQPPKEVVFHNRQRIGDMLMFTCAVRDFKTAFPNTRVNVISTAAHIFDHNPYVDRTLEPTEQNTIKIGPGKLTNASNRLDWHFANAYRVSIEDALKISIPQGESRPDIWLTEEEYNAPRPFEQPYWIICVSGEKGWGCKMYPFNKWQEVVDQNPDLTFVQIGTKGDNPPRLQGKNVIDHVGKTEDRETGVRDLFKLFLNAEGSIGLVSFHMHLSGALYKPSVVIAGAREPVHFTRYPGHQYLATDGTLPCAVSACWHCDINTCTNLVIREETIEKKIPKCVDIIPSEEVTKAIRKYYTGGRLTLGVPSQKPKFKNIVKTPNKPVIEKEQPLKEYGLDWNSGTITKEDWAFMQRVIKKHNIKTVLEFGAGMSTLLLNDLGLKVTTYETMPRWIEKVKACNPNADIRLWDGKTEIDLPQFDMAFVDGPSGGINREISTKLAVKHARIIMQDDGFGEHEKVWRKKYILPEFDGPIKEARKTYLYTKKEPVGGKGKKIKIVSTARGWGGCARSVTTIMKMLLKDGHDVEFIPFRNKVASREFIDILKNDLKNVKVSETYDSIREACDVLMVYADDFVWEFTTPEMEKVFSNIQAKRKVMVVNYRRGGVGEIPWTRGWDKYLFLNGNQQKDLLRVHPGVLTDVLSPCTDLSAFFEIQPNYELPVRIVRHNSQGDTKFPKNDEISKALSSRGDLEIHMMPGPSFVDPFPPRFVKYPKNQPPIPTFLGLGNLFWYSLPEGYIDAGPRVIIEAMAAGLPVIADNWGGAPDRVTRETGWICNSKEEMIEVIKNVTAEELKKKGEAARRRAIEVFQAERWVKELTGELCTALT